MPETIILTVPELIFESYSDVNEMVLALQDDMIIGEYQKGKISIRDGARILGITYREFLKWLSERNVSFINASQTELEESYKKFKEKINDESHI